MLNTIGDMTLQRQINLILERNPTWKSNSRIVGQAAEEWVELNLSCFRCGGKLTQYPNNQPGKDLNCAGCGKDYQLKAGKNIKVNRNGILKITGAEYSKTLASHRDNSEIDYIFVGYNARHTITFFGLVHSEDMREEYIIPRKPLSAGARRAGWQGCYLEIPKSQIQTKLSV